MFRRVATFLLLNAAIILTVTFLGMIFGLSPWGRGYHVDLKSLAIISLIWGFGGAFVSLALSRIVTKWMLALRVISKKPANAAEKEIVDEVYFLAKKAGLTVMPEVAIFEDTKMNAFATGPTKNRALVALSTTLLERMSREERMGVIGHEISHIANGDMVTMTLLQGVINASVIFFARLLAYALSASRKDSKGGASYYLLTYLFEVVFLLLGSIVVAAFSRYREFSADAGGAKLAGRASMIQALEKLKAESNKPADEAREPQAIAALMITRPRKQLLSLFASHPPLDERIERLKAFDL